jgi:prepilin-type processing-associated H-X9-DG protein
VFAQAREAARKTSCLSNQKQIGTALMMYAGDYDEGIVPWRRAAAFSGEPNINRMWTSNIQPYIKSGGGLTAEGVMKCPSFSTDKLAAGGATCNPAFDVRPFLPFTELYSHYGIAIPVAGGTGTQADPLYKFPGSASGAIVSLPAVNRPAETVIVSDGVTARVSVGVFSLFGCEAAAMHQEGGNLIFLDGHAKWTKGNAEKFLNQDSTGRYFMRYFTYDM